jgi:hypothetical protein
MVLYRYLQHHSNPLRLLYHLLSETQWDTYMLIPVTPQQWKQNLSIRRVLLGEFALRHVEATHNPRFRRASWWLNLHLYARPETPLSRFAGMLYDLLDPEIVDAETFDLSHYAEAYNSLSSYPGGMEISYSFDALAKFLAYTELSELSEAETVAAEIEMNLPIYGAIRETVLTAILRLGKIGADIAGYQHAATPTEKLGALAKATGDLNEFNDSVVNDTIVPERFLLQRIIRQWQHLTMAEIGAYGKMHTEQSANGFNNEATSIGSENAESTFTNTRNYEPQGENKK